MFVDKDLEWNLRSIRLPISLFLEKKYWHAPVSAAWAFLLPKLILYNINLFC